MGGYHCCSKAEEEVKKGKWKIERGMEHMKRMQKVNTLEGEYVSLLHTLTTLKGSYFE